MRRRLAFLVSATMALVLVAFIVPLAILVRSIGHSGLVVALLAIGPAIAAVVVARKFPETSGQELADTAGAHLVPADVAIVAGS